MIVPNCYPTLDDDQGQISEDEEFYVGQGCKSRGVTDHGIFNDSVISPRARTQRETCTPLVIGELSNDLDSSTTDESDTYIEESDDGEDDGELTQGSHPTKPGQLCFLSCGLFSLTME